MIKFDRARKRITILEMTPLVDVVFLLLIFFLLTSTSIQHGLEIDLAETRSGSVQEARPLVVSILPDDTVRVGREPVALEGLVAVLRARLADSPQRALTIEADRRVPFGVFAKVLDGAKLAGAQEISLATDILYEPRRP